jgi:hypothetical protein
MQNFLTVSLAISAALVCSLRAATCPGAESPPAGPGTLPASLNRHVPLRFERANLGDLVDWLRDKQGLKTVVDQAAIEQVGPWRELEIDVKVEHLPLKSALRLTLEPLKLSFVQRDDVLVVTTLDKARSNVYPVVYPVGDLLPKLAIPGNPEAFNYRPLTELITNVVAWKSWDDEGGKGSLATFETSLVVSQTAEIHDEIAALLADVRRVRAARSGDKPAIPATPGPWDKTFTMTFDKLSLPEALSRLAAATGVDILLDRSEIGEHRLLEERSADQPPDEEDLITAELEKTNLRQALREVLFPHDLGYIERYGAVIVTSHDKAEEFCRLQIYDVKPLVREREAAAEGGGELDYNAIQMLLSSAVSPRSWEDSGGPATMSLIEGFLVVLQTDEAHQQIASLLDQLRHVRTPAQPAGPSRPDLELRKALRDLTKCEFADVPLAEALDSYADKHKLDITLDRPALRRAGVAADSPVTLRLGELKLQTALEFLLEPFDLDYYMQEGGLVVSTAKVARKHPSPRVYDLSDLAATAQKPKVVAAEAGLLIQKTVAPSLWVEAGGNGTVVVFENMLVVSNSHFVHCQIEELLAELRRSK